MSPVITRPVLEEGLQGVIQKNVNESALGGIILPH